MKILWDIHGYPPTHNAGAEWMAYDINEHLKTENEITVMSRKAVPGFQQGVNALEHDNMKLKQIVRNYDLIFSHLGFVGKVFNVCRAFGKEKFFVIVHNSIEASALKVKKDRMNVIYNSHFTARANYQQRSMIFRPPLIADRYRKEKTGENAITLVNCFEPKGGKILAELAAIMPDRKFIGVLGGYGNQVIVDLPNLEYIANTVNMADIYARSEIVIQPSSYESYGKAACEAIATDTPVICTGTDGLREALDGAGVYVERNAQAYKTAIMKLNIGKQIKKCQKRTKQLEEQTAQDFENLKKFIYGS